MLENIRAKHVKEKEVNDNFFTLKKNTPRQINKDNNSHIAHICEDRPKDNVLEDLYIHSSFNDESFAIIGNEFSLNFYDSPSAADLSYYYFDVNSSVSIFIYDMKKSFSGLDKMETLVHQWIGSIRTAKGCISQLENYEISTIKIGVITEDNDVERRKRELKPILHPDPISEDIPSFMQSQRRADKAGDLARAELLKGFDEGKVTICGCTYEYDVRLFVDKKHDMYFIDGELQAT